MDMIEYLSFQDVELSKKIKELDNGLIVGGYERGSGWYIQYTQEIRAYEDIREALRSQRESLVTFYNTNKTPF